MVRAPASGHSHRQHDGLPAAGLAPACSGLAGCLDSGRMPGSWTAAVPGLESVVDHRDRVARSPRGERTGPRTWQPRRPRSYSRAARGKRAHTWTTLDQSARTALRLRRRRPGAKLPREKRDRPCPECGPVRSDEGPENPSRAGHPRAQSEAGRVGDTRLPARWIEQPNQMGDSPHIQLLTSHPFAPGPGRGNLDSRSATPCSGAPFSVAHPERRPPSKPPSAHPRGG